MNTHSHLASTSPADLHTQVAGRLHRNDQRYTPARRRLVDALLAQHRPITLPEILDADPDLASSSAYRTLDVLERCGVIRRLTIGNDHSHFELAEPFLDHHHHLICVNCGTLADIHVDDQLEALVDRHLADAAAAAGFTPQHHSLDLYGLCGACETDNGAQTS